MACTPYSSTRGQCSSWVPFESQGSKLPTSPPSWLALKLYCPQISESVDFDWGCPLVVGVHTTLEGNHPRKISKKLSYIFSFSRGSRRHFGFSGRQVTAFPSTLAVAATWDRKLGFAWGQAKPRGFGPPPSAIRPVDPFAQEDVSSGFKRKPFFTTLNIK